MKILYFHQHFCTPKGSAGIRSYGFAKKLIDRGHEVTMVCGSYEGASTGLDNSFKGGKRSGNVHGINVIEFELNYSNNDGFLKRTWLFLLFALRSVNVALFTKADLIFATSTPLTAGIPGIVARWIKRTPFVFEVRDLWPELPKEMKVITNPVILAMMSFLEWVSYKSAHRLIGLSPGIVAGIKKQNIADEKVALIPNGCDLDIFHKETTNWRPEGVANNDFMAVFTGTHGPANGLDAVLDVANELKKRNISNVKIVLIGQGKLKAALKKRAFEEGLTNVIFHETVPKKELAGLLASADIGLQILANIPAFYYGTSPNKFFDYLASGLPVLTNYPGWVADLIAEHNCGYFVEPDKPIAFADALCEASESKDKMMKMGCNSLNLAKNKFNRDDLASKFVTWLEETKIKSVAE